jgi:tetratricopeptide (TPR) repeat protein
MSSFIQRVTITAGRSLLPFAVTLLFWSSPSFGQARAAEEADLRGNRAEISLTVKDTSGQIILAPATVKIYHLGMFIGQAATSQGRAFFILNSLGDYTITVDASGYKSAQKDVSLPVAVRDEEDIYLRSNSAPEAAPTVPDKPLLAPKARKAFDKGLQALKEDKLDEAQKHFDEALKLAPNHPDVLYARAVVYLQRSDWANAQTLLEKATQLDPKHARAWSALGTALVNSRKFDQAIRPLQQSLALEPVGWETHWALAKAYYHLQQYEDSVKESQEAFSESHGASLDVELLLAQSLTAVGRYEDAAQTLRNFLKTHPNCSRADTARRWLGQLAANGKIHQD